MAFVLPELVFLKIFFKKLKMFNVDIQPVTSENIFFMI